MGALTGVSFVQVSFSLCFKNIVICVIVTFFFFFSLFKSIGPSVDVLQAFSN